MLRWFLGFRHAFSRLPTVGSLRTCCSGSAISDRITSHSGRSRLGFLDIRHPCRLGLARVGHPCPARAAHESEIVKTPVRPIIKTLTSPAPTRSRTRFSLEVRAIICYNSVRVDALWQLI